MTYRYSFENTTLSIQFRSAIGTTTSVAVVVAFEIVLIHLHHLLKQVNDSTVGHDTSLAILLTS